MTFEQLLDAARRGSEEAIAAIWRDLHPRLVRYLRPLAPGAADDVASETWLEAARDLHRFRGDEADFRAWLFTIARHRLIDWRRRVGRRPEEATGAAVVDGPAPDDTARGALDRIDTDAALGLLATLPADQAEVVLLRVVGGLDAAHVASIVGKKPGTVRVLQHRALRRLATTLAEQPGRAPVTQ